MVQRRGSAALLDPRDRMLWSRFLRDFEGAVAGVVGTGFGLGVDLGCGGARGQRNRQGNGQAHCFQCPPD